MDAGIYHTQRAQAQRDEARSVLRPTLPDAVVCNDGAREASTMHLHDLSTFIAVVVRRCDSCSPS